MVDNKGENCENFITTLCLIQISVQVRAYMFEDMKETATG